MDRTPEPFSPVVDALPPVSEKTAFTLQIVGVAAAALTAIPAIFGGVSPGVFSTAALVLLAVGLLAAGYGLTLRPGDWRAWVLASATALFANFGFPSHWDSFAMVCRVLAGATAVGALLTWVQPVIRYAVLSALLLMHYGAILTATTWPDPAPWGTTQSALRIYMPYYKFMYLSNAYHFYSPEPGPASLLFGLVTYELDEIDPKTNKNKIESSWIDLPNRATQFKDPLGLTYQRRLSISELVATTTPSNFTPISFEKNDAVNRRRQAAVTLDDPGSRIPLQDLPGDSVVAQYRVPTSPNTRYLFPSYARHIAVEFEAEFSSPRRKVLSVKLVRVEHRVMQPGQFLTGDNPYNPTTFRPYYIGEYNPAGELMNPTDPMLYWLLPIVPLDSPNAQGRYFKDYMSLYLKHEYPWTGGFKGAP